MPLPLTIEEAVAALRSGDVTSVQLTAAALARIEALDDRVGAFIEVNAAARAQAEQADADLAAGTDRGPLHGIPFGLKDILATADQPTTANSLVLDPAWGTGYDSVVTERVRAAGAVIMGKLVLSEFAIGAPDAEKPFPTPRNPWDLDRSASGSSSGTGIAVATGMILGGIGTDTGGSVRGPASFNGHTGLKVTFGRVPKWGVTPLGYSLDSIGPMARSAWDCAAILNVIAGHDPRDSTAAPSPTDDYLEGIDRGIEGLRVGVPRAYFLDHPELKVDTKAAVEATIGQLADLGADVREVELPHSDVAKDANTLTMLSEAFAYHRPDMGSARWSDYGASTRMTIASVTGTRSRPRSSCPRSMSSSSRRAPASPRSPRRWPTPRVASDSPATRGRSISWATRPSRCQPGSPRTVCPSRPRSSAPHSRRRSSSVSATPTSRSPTGTAASRGSSRSRPSQRTPELGYAHRSRTESEASRGGSIRQVQ
jgi:aspartyl-tRNA(Asn)/glutamyl-tRNA(Gln) amidotransferase subunit A